VEKNSLTSDREFWGVKEIPVNQKKKKKLSYNIVCVSRLNNKKSTLQFRFYIKESRVWICGIIFKTESF